MEGNDGGADPEAWQGPDNYKELETHHPHQLHWQAWGKDSSGSSAGCRPVTPPPIWGGEGTISLGSGISCSIDSEEVHGWRGDTAWRFWDVKGGFQNVTKKEVIERMGLTGEDRWCKKWMTSFMWERSFAVSWDGKDRGGGKTNVGMPQGSTLSLLVFLLWMVPILEEMERRIRWEVGADIELPSYVDHIHLGIYDHERRGAGIQDLDGEGETIRELLARADRVLKDRVLKKGRPLQN